MTYIPIGSLLGTGLAIVGGKIVLSPVTTITSALGTGQSTGLVPSTAITVINGGAAGTCVTLPSGVTNRSFKIVNRNSATNPLSVYPPSGGTIENNAANAAVTIVLDGDAEFVSSNGLTWWAL